MFRCMFLHDSAYILICISYGMCAYLNIPWYHVCFCAIFIRETCIFPAKLCFSLIDGEYKREYNAFIDHPMYMGVLLFS